MVLIMLICFTSVSLKAFESTAPALAAKDLATAPAADSGPSCSKSQDWLWSAQSPLTHWPVRLPFTISKPAALSVPHKSWQNRWTIENSCLHEGIRQIRPSQSH